MQQQLAHEVLSTGTSLTLLITSRYPDCITYRFLVVDSEQQVLCDTSCTCQLGELVNLYYTEDGVIHAAAMTRQDTLEPAILINPASTF